jgi:hypothetical protein
VKGRLISELEKRLDLDIDDMLESPKLRLQLSPGELDKQLLELYKNIANGPRGDVLRVIGGGQEVAFQDLYIKRRAGKKRRNQAFNQASLSFGPFDSLGDDSSEESQTASQWVQQALNKNLQGNLVPTTILKPGTKSKSPQGDNNNMKMCAQLENSRIHVHSNSPMACTAKQFCPPRKSTLSFSVLI